jgi:hypothetical protein
MCAHLQNKFQYILKQGDSGNYKWMPTTGFHQFSQQMKQQNKVGLQWQGLILGKTNKIV